MNAVIDEKTKVEEFAEELNGQQQVSDDACLSYRGKWYRCLCPNCRKELSKAAAKVARKELSKAEAKAASATR